MEQDSAQSNRPYRLYFVDKEDHIARAHDIASPSDDHVLDLAAKMWSDQSLYSSVEVWEQARKVGRYP